MNIHCICLVKDEGDIVGDVVSDARKWADYIYIYDNGSTDGSTEVLKDLSEKFDEIIFYKWSDRHFHNTIRHEIYHAFKHNSKKGDWWCRLDADEFYIDNPRQFISQIDDGSNTLLHSSYNYYFTEKDLEQYNRDPDSFSYKHLKYYKNNWSEIRFVRDNGHLYWPPSSSWPVINMKIFDKKIRVRHYQYRSPEQIRKRAENRKLAYPDFDPYKKRNIGFLGKEAIIDPELRLVSHKVLDYDSGDHSLKANEDIPEWKGNISLINRLKILVKNGLFRLNLLGPIYNFLGKKQ